MCASSEALLVQGSPKKLFDVIRLDERCVVFTLRPLGVFLVQLAITHLF